MDRYFRSSLTRIAPFEGLSFEAAVLPRGSWDAGDYVVVEVLSDRNPNPIELTSGRQLELGAGDLVIGVIGDRYATLEATGTWRAAPADGSMEILGGGGLFGKCTSQSRLIKPLTRIRYLGHTLVDGSKARMQDYRVQGSGDRTFEAPVILIIGTSMSAGKTTAARVLLRRLKQLGHRTMGTKLTGAGRYRDILSMADAGADHIFDFVDAGLPSTICPVDEYRQALGALLSRMADESVDVAVVEAGASPLEPYNGASAVEALRPNIRYTVLCASDPYAVMGVMTAFDIKPDLVTGPTSNTEAGIALVRELTGLEAIDVLDRNTHSKLDRVLSDAFPDPNAPGL